jgi:hypothetical protein
MSQRRRLACMLALSLGASVPSTAPGQAVMTFESLAAPMLPGTSGYRGIGNVYDEAGFRLVATHIFPARGPHFCVTEVGIGPYTMGEVALFNCLDGGTTTLTKIGGGTFSLHSIDLSPNDQDHPGAKVLFTGVRAGGPPVTAEFDAPSNFVFERHVFAGFDDLLSVQWTHAAPYHTFDNITLDVVVTASPEPTAALLLGAGLAALAAIRRGKRRT